MIYLKILKPDIFFYDMGIKNSLLIFVCISYAYTENTSGLHGPQSLNFVTKVWKADNINILKQTTKRWKIDSGKQAQKKWQENLIEYDPKCHKLKYTHLHIFLNT